MFKFDVIARNDINSLGNNHINRILCNSFLSIFARDRHGVGGNAELNMYTNSTNITESSNRVQVIYKAVVSAVAFRKSCQS